MPNELGPLCPHRGSKTNMTTGTGASTVLGAGELFVEYPDTGVGSGTSKIKIGDGVTAYSLLPYALGDTSVQEVTYNESTATTVSQALAEAASGSALGNIIAGLKKAVELSSTEISAFAPPKSQPPEVEKSSFPQIFFLTSGNKTLVIHNILITNNFKKEMKINDFDKRLIAIPLNSHFEIN
jgi:hypothetical protein